MATVNWNDPTNSTTYTDVLGDLRDRDENLGTMTFTSDTNIPTNFIRWNNTDGKFQKYNGSTWDDLDLGDTTLNSLTTDTISEETSNNGVDIEGVKLLDSFAELSNISAPATPSSNLVRLYNTTSELFAKDDAGDVWSLTPSWQSWTPTVGSEAGTWGGTVNFSEYFQFGPLVIAKVRTSAATPSANTRYITISTPTSVATHYSTVKTGGVLWILGDIDEVGVVRVDNDTTDVFRFYRNDNTDITNAQSVSFEAMVIYEAV